MEPAIDANDMLTRRLSATQRKPLMDNHWHQMVGAMQDKTVARTITAATTTRTIQTTTTRRNDFREPAIIAGSLDTKRQIVVRRWQT